MQQAAHCIFLLSCFNLLRLTFACNCTLHPNARTQFHNAVLSRRTRTAVFPNNAFVLISPAFTKAIIDGRPSGLSYSIEFDMYSKVPDTVEAWEPTLLINKVNREKAHDEQLKQAEKAKHAQMVMTPAPAMYPAEMLEHLPIAAHVGSSMENIFDYHPAVDDYIEPNFWPSDSNIRYQWPVEVERDFKISLTDTGYDFNGRSNLRDFYAKNRKFYNKTHSDVVQHFYKIPKLKKSKINKSNHKVHYKERWFKNVPKQFNTKYEDVAAELPKWTYYAAYRERRELFEQLETVGKIFNFNMKACIQRAMCEVGTNLRPYGESLMDDILRIILTIPANIELDENDYSPPASNTSSGINCVTQFLISCPYPVLDLVTQNIANSDFKANTARM